MNAVIFSEMAMVGWYKGKLRPGMKPAEGGDRIRFASTPMRPHPPRTPRQCGRRCRVRVYVCPRSPRSVSTEKCSRSAVKPQYLRYPATYCAARAFLPKRRRVSTGLCMDNLQCSSMPNLAPTQFCPLAKFWECLQ